MIQAQLTNENTNAQERGANSLRGYDHSRFSNDRKYALLVREAAHYYDDMRDLRKKFVRDIDYYMGRQFNDKVVYNGREYTVQQYMEIKGMAAIPFDIISDKMMSLKGTVRQQYMSPQVKSVDTDQNDSNMAGIFSEFLRQNDNNNNMSEQNADRFEQFADMGFVGAKVQYTFREGREDVFVDSVDQFKLALPVFAKKDASDVEFIAEAHDLTWPALLQLFAHTTAEENELSQIYAANAQNNAYVQGYNDTGMNQTDHLDDFYHSSVVGKYRVIEIWTKEYNRAYWYHDRLNATVGYRPLKDKAAMDAENEKRKQDNIVKDENGVPVLDADGNPTYYVDPDELQLIEYEFGIEDLWYYRFISPNGYLLDEGVSPYKVVREGYSFYYHPYVFLAYPCLQGEVRSFVDRMIDRQRQYTHDNIMLDFIIMNSAKGAMAIDVESISDKQSFEEMVENYVKVDGIILYTSKKGGNMPTQIQNKSLPAGIDLIMQRDANMVERQSGIQPAMQGVHKNTSGKQYQIEKDSAVTSVTDYISSYNNFQLRVAKKQVWTMQGYYSSQRSIIMTGEDFKTYFDRKKMSDIDLSLAMAPDNDNPVIRDQMKDIAYQAYQRNEIDFGQFLDFIGNGGHQQLKRAWMDFNQRKAQQAMEQAAAGQQPVIQGQPQQQNTNHILPSKDGEALPAQTGSAGAST